LNRRLSGSVAQSIAGECASYDAATQHQKKLIEAGAILVPIADPLSSRLRDIFDPPSLLFARGRVELLSNPHAGDRGHAVPHTLRHDGGSSLARDLSSGGLTIVSGWR
jgi:DNA processing protein